MFLLDSSFREEVLGYLDGLSNVESEGECTLGSNYNTKYADKESINKELYPLKFLFKQTCLSVLRVLY